MPWGAPWTDRASSRYLNGVPADVCFGGAKSRSDGNVKWQGVGQQEVEIGKAARGMSGLASDIED